MSNLMIKIYLQTIQKFNEHSQVKTNPAAAFLDAIGVVLDVICTILTPLLEPVANLMSFPFDGVASLPILEDKKLDQEWLKKNFSQNLSIPKHFEFFSYDQFFRYFIRVNLNYFEGSLTSFGFFGWADTSFLVTTCSPIFKLLQGEEKFWPTAAQQRHFQEQYKKSVHTLLGEWVDLQKNTKMLFGRGMVF
jgi:hypothetical protein